MVLPTCRQIQIVFMAGILLCSADAPAQSLCPSVDAAWFTRVASGGTASYGFSTDGAVQLVEPLITLPLTSVGVIKLLGTSITPAGGGASLIQGNVTGTETFNLLGTVSTLTFAGASAFTIDTRTCSGTLTRVFSNTAEVSWHIVLVDGENTIRFLDPRAVPSMRPGTMQLMK